MWCFQVARERSDRAHRAARPVAASQTDASAPPAARIAPRRHPPAAVPYIPHTALEQTFPGRRITHDPVLGRWTALRRVPPTQREQSGGVKYMIACPSPEALGSALADQVELAHTHRQARL